MAISFHTNTYGLFPYWLEWMEANIWHFNQVVGESAPILGGCPVYIQSERERLAKMIDTTFQRMRRHLGFPIVPIWDSQDFVLKAGVPYQRQIFTLQDRYIEAFGQRNTAVIEAGATVTYSDVDGDGVDDTGTVTVTTAIDPSEIRAFFQVADGAPDAVNPTYRVIPTRMVDNGATVTLTFHRADLVKPSVWAVEYDDSDPNRQTRAQVNMALAADFVTALDVYRVYTDTTTPVTIKSDRYLEGYCSDLDQFSTATGVVQIVDSEHGEFRIRPPSDLTCPFYTERFTVYYQAGYPLDSNYRVSEGLSMALVRLVNAGNPTPRWCAMEDRSRDIWTTDREPMPRTELMQTDLGNPFGMKRGQVESWREISDYALPVIGGSMNRR